MFLGLQADKKIAMRHRLEGGFAFFEASGRWDGVALQERVEVAIYLDRNSGDVGRDLMCGPSSAGTDGLRVAVRDHGEECIRFRTSFDHSRVLTVLVIYPIYGLVGEARTRLRPMRYLAEAMARPTAITSARSAAVTVPPLAGSSVTAKPLELDW